MSLTMKWPAVACTWAAVAAAAACLPVQAISQQGWMGYGRNPQHTALGSVAAMPWQIIRWSTPVDTAPSYGGNGDLLTHYGSPLITAKNTVIVTVKKNSSFYVEGIRGDTGTLLWQWNTDYTIPPYTGWYPACGCTLTPNGQLIVPGAGGTIWILTNLDTANMPSVNQACFYGLTEYKNNQTSYNSGLQICTPITTDASGNVYFGYTVSAAVPNGLTSGIALVQSNGNGAYATATAALPSTDVQKPVLNCAPAISNDGSTVYIAFNNTWGWGQGYLVGLDTSTLKTKYSIRLLDPKNGADASLVDDGTASPAVGPDGDVFYGVLENQFASNHDRGWMLHFDGTLAKTKTPGAFGWDDTAAIFPTTVVPKYSGKSPYLLLTKYNNYSDPGIGGNGKNKVAVLAPDDTEIDPISGVTTMKEVETLLGPTPNSGQAGVREWCVNTVAIDPVDRVAFVNSEDGTVYKWGLVGNSIKERMPLTAGIGEAYTSTIEGPDGACYAISNAMLYAIGAKYLAQGKAENATGQPGDTTTLTATFIRTNDGAPVAGANVSFTIGSTTLGTGVTSSQGVATLSYAVPQNAVIGKQKFVAALSATNVYNAASCSNTLNIEPHAVAMTSHSVSGKVGQTISLSTTITRDDGTALANATVTYTLGSTTIGTAVTNSGGVATLSYTIPSGTAIGKHTITMSFAGDTTDKSKAVNSTLTVTH